jgi:diguanylate cyclase
MLHMMEKSLVEQMGLTGREITRRLHLIDFTESDRECLLAALPVVTKAMDRIIADFYKIQLEDSEVASIIGDIDTLKRLQGSMRGYTLSLFQANYDDEYVNNRLRIGKVHKRLAVAPKLYISALGNLQLILDQVLEEAKPEIKGDVISALHKIILFDTELIFEAYIDSFLFEMETAKNEVERYSSELGFEVEALSRQLHEISTKDALTGIYNRRAMFDLLERECRVAARYKLPLTILYMDLNGFKPINDTHGHDAGDRVLRQVGESLLAITRAVDVPARYGGDEFCVVMPRTTLKLAEIPIRRLMEDFKKRRDYPVTFSIGLVQTGPEDVEDVHDLIKLADDSMYAAKARARADGNFHVEFGARIDVQREAVARS